MRKLDEGSSWFASVNIYREGHKTNTDQQVFTVDCDDMTPNEFAKKVIRHFELQYTPAAKVHLLTLSRMV